MIHALMNDAIINFTWLHFLGIVAFFVTTWHIARKLAMMEARGIINKIGDVISTILLGPTKEVIIRLDQRVFHLEGRFTHIESRFTRLEDRFTDLGKDIADIKADVRVLNAKLPALEGRVERLEFSR